MTQSTTTKAPAKTAAEKAAEKAAAAEAAQAAKEAADTKAKAIDKAKRDAAAGLVRQHQSDFNDTVKADLAAQGIEWSPRLSAEERKAKDLRALLAENPDLARQILSEVESTPVVVGDQHITDPASGF